MAGEKVILVPLVFLIHHVSAQLLPILSICPTDNGTLVDGNSTLISENGTVLTDRPPPARIAPCNEFKIVEVDANELAKLSLTSSEAQIASEGHWDGVKPDHYRIGLNFTSATHYEGALAIDITVAAATSKIFLHVGSKLKVDLTTIYVQERGCQLGQSRQAPVCIETIGVVSGQDMVFIQLSSQLLAETKYTVVIQKFEVDVSFYNQYNKDSPNSGVFWADADGSGFLRPFVPAAMTTVFRLREARTAFPCLDHPRLKARFTLCMEHSDDLLALSNTPVQSSVGKQGFSTKRTCFETTPPLATYLFTFSLLHEYETEQRLMDTDLVVELLIPKGQGVSYRWLYDAAVEPLRFMGGSTRFRYPLKRIGFIMVEPFPYAGVENFGTLTLNAKLVKGPIVEIPGRVLVNHELVHQWFGGIVTTTDWREICVQEGLTAYYEWAMTAQTLKAENGGGENLTVNERARRALSALADDYSPLLRDYQTNRDIIDNCYGVPPLLFKTIADAFGDHTFYELFASITSGFQFDNADIDAWDEALTEATVRQDLRNYLRAWFTLPGYPRLFISKSGNSVELSQATSSGVRPIIVTLMEATAKGGQPGPPIILDKQSAVLPLTDPKAAWFLVNPDDSASPVRKIYTLEHYQRFQFCNETESDDCNIDPLAKTRDRRKLEGKEFCSALLGDRFPWGTDDQTVFDADEWREFFNTYVEKGELDVDCDCCLRSKEQLIAAGRACAKVWNARCRNLRINRQLGRAFKVDEL